MPKKFVPEKLDVSTKRFQAFVTGSYAYGQPRADSDIDLVIFVDKGNDLSLLERHGDSPSDTDEPGLREDYIAAGGTPVRFGKLNIIVCDCEAYFEVWRRGTEELKLRAPVSRDDAIEHMRQLRKAAGFHVPEPRNKNDGPTCPF
jgi:predicted nucleotidyltransferase